MVQNYKFLWLFVPFMILVPAGVRSENSNYMQTMISPRLWFLSSETDFTHAKLFAFDPEDRVIVEEIMLPPEKIVISAVWSPDFDRVAVVSGNSGEHVDKVIGNEICVFSRNGVMDWCESLQFNVLPAVIINVRASFAPVVWINDNQFWLVTTTSGFDDNLQMDAKLNLVSVDEQSIEEHFEVTYNAYIVDWLWSPDGSFALVSILNGQIEIDQIRLLWIDNTIIDVLFNDKRSTAIDVTSGGVVFLVSQEDNLIIRTREVGERVTTNWEFPLIELRYDNEQLIPWRFGLAHYGLQVAFLSYFNRLQEASFFVFDIVSQEVSLLHSGYVYGDQIKWSAENLFIAIRVCETRQATKCHIDIYRLASEIPEQITIDLPESRNPQWENYIE